MEKIDLLYKHCIENLNVAFTPSKIGTMNVTKGQYNALVEKLSKDNYDILTIYDESLKVANLIVTRFRKSLDKRLEDLVQYCITNKGMYVERTKINGVYITDAESRVIRRRLAYLGYDTKNMHSTYGVPVFMISEYGKKLY